MANLKNITDVPELTALEGTEKVLLNVDGSAKQATVSLIKPAEEWDLDITVNVSFDDSALIFTPVINAGTFDVIKNKILNNEYAKIKSQIVCPSPEDASIVGYENSVICNMTYAPQNLFGSNSNPEMISLLGHSMLADMFLVYTILPDNTITVGEY